MLLILSLCGCSGSKESPEKLQELEFTVVADVNLPEELMSIIEERKTSPFKVTYTDDGWLYVAEGYGTQNGGGYSIQVNDFFEAENALYVDTNLCGPQNTDVTDDGQSFPYIVLKTEAIDKNVVFR